MNDVRESFLVFCRSPRLTIVVACLLEVVLEIPVELSFCRVEAPVFEQASCRHNCRLADLHADDHGRGCDPSLCLASISHAPRVLEAMSRTRGPHRC